MKQFNKVQRKAFNLLSRLEKNASLKMCEDYGQKEILKFKNNTDYQNLSYSKQVEIDKTLNKVSSITIN